MKKLLTVLVTVLAVAAMLLSGCGSDEPTANPSGKELTGILNIAGSTSVQPYSDLLKEAFEAKHAGVTVNVQGGGSTAGVTAALSGAADIGAASRKIKESEKQQGLHIFTIAKDGIAIVVHPSNPIGGLSMDQVRQIFAGEITNWSEVGGNHSRINAITREEGSGTRGAFEDIVMGDSSIADDLIAQGSTGAVSAAVANDPNGIGYISLAALDETVKAIKVDGAGPTVDNIVSGDYKVARPFNYVTKEDPSGLVEAFLDFVFSTEGQFIAEEMGLIAVEKVEGTIDIAGSTSVQPYSDLLKEAFENLHPNITVNVQGGGSTAGFTSVASGAADIGAMSRELKDSEEEAGYPVHVIAKDGIALVVHKSNPVDNLSIEQVRDIFAGEITNWQEVGGNNVEINAITREEGSGTRGAFEDIVMGDKEISGSLITQGSTGAVMAAVANDPQAIGYVSLASVDNTVKSIKVDGAEATVASIKSGSYKVARPFSYVTPEEPTFLAVRFIEFTLSEKGQKIAAKLGLIPVK